MEHDDQAVGMLSKLNNRFAQLQQTLNATATTASALQPNIPTMAAVLTSTLLPTLEIKKFSGDIKNWLAFWEQFDGTI